MADFNGSLVVKRVLKQLGDAELRRVKGMIGSKTLRAAVTLIIAENEQRADLFIPHYWAIWYHDGRGRVSPVNARKLVFFDDPNDDPRIQGGRPVTESQVRRLTRDQYREGLRRNQERAASGGRPFMYVVDSVGKSAPRPFFTKLEQGASERADVIVAREFEKDLLAWIDRDKDVKSETRVADFGLGF